MTTTKPFALGSVSTGTLRTEDLLPALINTLMQFDPSSSTLGEAHAFQDDGLQDDVGMDLIQALMDEIQSYCPPFVYFGAHPGDGADFGFWPDWDALEEAFDYDRDGIPSNEVVFDDQQIIVRFRCDCISLTENHVPNCGRDDVTIMDLDHNVVWSTL